MPPSPQRKLPPLDSPIDRAGSDAAAGVVAGPIVRGGLTLGAGIVIGNVLGFVRVAVTAYLLGTHSRADSLAVAIGPIDTLNQVLISTLVFTFVPMLTARGGAERTALFLRLNRLFLRLFLVLTAAIILLAPGLIHLLAPGLPPAWFAQAATLLRIGCLSLLPVGLGAIQSALLYTGRRFAPSAFHQATLNVFTVLGALGLWKWLGVYGFAIGYTAGAWAQFAVVSIAARSGLDLQRLPQCVDHWRDLIFKPATILIYSGFVMLNITVTRAYATQVGPGTAAAFEYCMRCIGAPLAFLVIPISNSLLPEIARLRSRFRVAEALRLIDRTLAVAALASTAACAFAIAVRQPVIALMFQRGSFTAESTRLVSAVFLGFAPSLIGWTMLELTSRSLFALDRPWLPLCTSTIPVLFNIALLLGMRNLEPQYIGVGSSLGLLVAPLLLFGLMRAKRQAWLAAC